MTKQFSEQLDAYVKRTRLPLRSIAEKSGIPHQTVHNWLKGSQPRWHNALDEDLSRLGAALRLSAGEIRELQQLARSTAKRSDALFIQEVTMIGTYRIPKGWYVSGDAPEKYVMGVDPEVNFNNSPSVTIKAGDEVSDFAALMQMVKADLYQGKRLQFSAAVRSIDVVNRAALFMRISGASGKILAFDNMRDRPVTGTTGWEHYSIVLDVAENAETILFGILLSLGGQIWMSDVQLDVVARDVPTTDLIKEIESFFPVNLDFEE